MSDSEQRLRELISDSEQRLHEVISEACKHPPGSPARQKNLTRIIRLITPRLWRESTPYYQDALQQTWLYFVQRVCTTYNPDRGSIVAWLNTYLRYRYQDLLKKANEQRAREIPEVVNYQESWFGTATDISAPEYGSISLLEQVTQWVETDPEGVLRCTHPKQYPHVNCQAVILLRLPPETPWKDISAKFNVPIPTLSAFYQRQCMPCLRKFAGLNNFGEKLKAWSETNSNSSESSSVPGQISSDQNTPKQPTTNPVYRFALPTGVQSRERKEFKRNIEILRQANPQWTVVWDSPKPNESEAVIVMRKDKDLSKRRLAYWMTSSLSEVIEGTYGR